MCLQKWRTRLPSNDSLTFKILGFPHERWMGKVCGLQRQKLLIFHNPLLFTGRHSFCCGLGVFANHSVLNSLSSLPAAAQYSLVSSLCGWSSYYGGKSGQKLRRDKKERDSWRGYKRFRCIQTKVQTRVCFPQNNLELIFNTPRQTLVWNQELF